MGTDIVAYKKGSGICLITLNRPQALNALNTEMLEKLSRALDKAGTDDSVKVVIITGAGDRAFSAGADIEFLNGASPLEVRSLAQLAAAVNNEIETLGKVVIAAINGYALGGGLELAEACTLRIAVKQATLGHPEVRIGAVAGWGGMARLPRLIGIGRAAELLLTGRLISADEALQAGLVNRVVEPGGLLKEAEDLAMEIAAQAPVAVRMTWEAMHRGLSLSLEEATYLGADYFGLIATTDDFREGTGSFLKKIRPAFKGG